MSNFQKPHVPHTNIGDEIYSRKNKVPLSAKFLAIAVVITLLILIIHPYILNWADSQ